MSKSPGCFPPTMSMRPRPAAQTTTAGDIGVENLLFLYKRRLEGTLLQKIINRVSARRVRNPSP